HRRHPARHGRGQPRPRHRAAPGDLVQPAVGPDGDRGLRAADGTDRVARHRGRGRALRGVDRAQRDRGLATGGAPAPGAAAGQAGARIHEALKRLEPDWADMETMAGMQPLIVTYMPPGSFDRYTDHRRREGADLAHLKPLHMNATDRSIEALLEASREPVG